MMTGGERDSLVSDVGGHCRHATSIDPDAPVLMRSNAHDQKRLTEAFDVDCRAIGGLDHSSHDAVRGNEIPPRYEGHPPAEALMAQHVHEVLAVMDGDH